MVYDNIIPVLTDIETVNMEDMKHMQGKNYHKKMYEMIKRCKK